MSKPPVIFYSGRLLPPSETFVRAQAERLSQFTPYYVGSRRVEGLSIPPERTVVVNSGSLVGAGKEAIYKWFGYAPELVRHIRAIAPRLIHAHFGVCGALALPIVRRVKLPLIVTFYGLDATMTDEYARTHSISTRVYLQRREALKRETDLLIAVSEFIRDRLIAQGFPADKIIAHYYGVDTDRFQPDPNVEREPIVLFVGRLAEKKGCEYLIRAMAKVEAQNEEAELAIIGDGPRRGELEALAKRELRRYRFLGLQPSETVQQWMNRARLLAAPSVTASTGDSEGLPTVVVEAQSMGLPVVGSIHAGIPQAVVPEETGFLAAERDWQALAAYILRLFDDGDLWQRCSVKARERMRADFDLSKQTQRLEQLYSDVLKGNVAVS